MEEGIIRYYQEAIALLSLRNNGIEIYGEYDYDENGGVSFVLNYFPENKLKKMKFKYMPNATEALKYFIKCSQNIYKLR